MLIIHIGSDNDRIDTTALVHALKEIEVADSEQVTLEEDSVESCVMQSFDCTHCDESFLTENELVLHKGNIHDNISFTCSFCDFKCVSTSILEFHMNEHNKSQSSTFYCDLCDFSAETQEALSEEVTDKGEFGLFIF